MHVLTSLQVKESQEWNSFIFILIARTPNRLATTILTPKELHHLQQSYRLLASSNAAPLSFILFTPFFIPIPKHGLVFHHAVTAEV